MADTFNVITDFNRIQQLQTALWWLTILLNWRSFCYLKIYIPLPKKLYNNKTLSSLIFRQIGAEEHIFCYFTFRSHTCIISQGVKLVNGFQSICL